MKEICNVRGGGFPGPGGGGALPDGGGGGGPVGGPVGGPLGGGGGADAFDSGITSGCFCIFTTENFGRLPYLSPRTLIN